MQGSDAPLFFDGVPADAVEALLAGLERREFTSGATVIAEGEPLHAMFIIAEGVVDVTMAGPDGRDHPLNRLGGGATLGEMSVLTGAPASATVRAVGPLAVLVLSEDELHLAAARYPRLYHNLGAMLALKVARSDRRVVGGRRGVLSILEPHAAPARLGYALAASVAWHTRRPTLLLVLDEHAEASTLEPPGAHQMVARPTGRFGPAHLSHTLDDLRRRYEHVLVQSTRRVSAHAGHHVHLLGADDAAPPRDAGDSTRVLRAWSAGAQHRGPDATGVVHVPPLRAADEHALADGWLPSTTPAGARIGWAARDLLELKVGLALGGGGLMGYAHVGVLRELERAGLGFDYLAGTSIGGVVASLYALDHGPEGIADILDSAAQTLVRPALSTRSLLSNDKLQRYLRRLGEHARFEDLHVPLALLASDIASGNEVVFRRGLMWPATLATVAIPGLFPAQPIGPYMLVDGGVLNPVPADVVADMGADVVLAVRLRSEPNSAQTDAVGVPPMGQAPSMLEVLTRSLDLMQARVAPRAEAATTVLIEPRCEGAPGMGLRNFVQGRRYIQAGEAAAQAALPRLTALLPWLRT